ncbi:hypothetical protein [Photobacterium sp. GB-36]|uniref:hypothetical protein n=1 Tax=Photobacterium sp. GB-36 TaxID=2022108 RepID=UPI001E3FF5AE|nr:hypothetical protein [Photobacterium sp. GB-36]
MSDYHGTLSDYHGVSNAIYALHDDLCGGVLNVHDAFHASHYVLVFCYVYVQYYDCNGE